MRKDESSLVIKNVGKVYNQNTSKPFVALDNISMEIPSGGSLALLGHNGAGKTTLIKIITTLLRPTFGSAVVAGMDLSTHQTMIKYIIGYTTQDVSLDVNITVMDTLILQSLYYGLMDNRKTIDYLLDVTDLHNDVNTVVRHLSGGMKRRLMIAKALVHNPKIVILDEPTVGIDLVMKEKIVACVQALRDDGKTILLTTHSFDEVERLSDSVAIFQRGRKVFFGTMDDVAKGGGDFIKAFLPLEVTPQDVAKVPLLSALLEEGKFAFVPYEDSFLDDGKNCDLPFGGGRAFTVPNSPDGINTMHQVATLLGVGVEKVSSFKVSKHEAIEKLMIKYAKYK